MVVVSVIVVLLGFLIKYVFFDLLPPYIRKMKMKKYFASEEFLQHKASAALLVAEFNEIASYIGEMRKANQFTLGASSTGQNAHLSTFTNTSNHGYRRDRNVANYSSPNVHNTSLQVVRNASANPIQYLIKYFDIGANEETLTNVETLGESISRLENALASIRVREQEISKEISPPPFITKYFLREFREQIGITIPALHIPYPTYSFQYVSAGGNSSQVAQVKLDGNTIDALIETLAEKIRFKNSAAGQRALMTAAFRNYIKVRDDFTCRLCGVSTYAEANLLLEIDHIKPVSKGGLSVETNLQTLCWRCNRTKSNKEL